MAGFDALFIAEWIVIPLMLAVLSAFWKLKAELQGAREDTREELAKRQKMWDEEMIKITHNFTELMADHAEIKRELKHISKELGEKVEKIMSDHSDHDKSMAAVLEMVRVIERRSQ